MFGLFKRQMAPEGPFAFTDQIRIERPATDVYQLLDFADPMNAKIAQGHMLRPGEAPGQWRLVMIGLEDHEHLIELIHAEPPLRYVVDCKAVPTIGRLQHAREAYSLEPAGANACTLRLDITAHLVPGLSARQFANEEKLLSAACHNAVARLKIHAEKGPDAARDAEMDSSNDFRINV